MNILILGGNSPRHYEWIRKLGAFLTAKGHAVILHDYAHWETGEPAANIEREISALKSKVADLSEYAVIGKSIGTVIATLATTRGVLKPSQCVFLGIPYDGIADRVAEFTPSLASLPPTVVLQNEYDPYGNAKDLRVRLEAAHMQNLHFISIPSNETHDYLDLKFIESQLYSNQ